MDGNLTVAPGGCAPEVRQSLRILFAAHACAPDADPTALCADRQRARRTRTG